MMEFEKEEVSKAVSLIASTITKCEKMQLKFPEGTSQHTLLKNRIKALYISKSLLTGEQITNYTSQELKDALPPVVSIINKSTKGQSKYEKGSPQFNRFEPLIRAMGMAKECLEHEISKG